MSAARRPTSPKSGGARRAVGSRPSGPKAAGTRGGGPKGTGSKSTGSKGPAGKSTGPRGAGAKGGRPSGGRRVGANTPTGRRSAPKGLGGMQVEGRQSVRELLLAGRRKVHEILIADDVDHADVLDDIVELAADFRVPVHEMSRRRIDAASHTEASQGVVAHAEELPTADLDDLCRKNPSGAAPFLLALDGVTDPGNLGALIRTAECAGVSGMVLPRHRAVHVTPTVTKAAAGAVEHVPIALVGGLPTAITRMRDAGVWVIGLDASGDRTIHDLDVGGQPVCLVLGAEGSGLSRLVRERCDVISSIPLLGKLGSLNVSVAGAVACYEIVRQRR